MVANSPAARSATATPTLVGWSPACPVIDMIPPCAWIRKSKPGRPAAGPSLP